MYIIYFNIPNTKDNIYTLYYTYTTYVFLFFVSYIENRKMLLNIIPILLKGIIILSQMFQVNKLLFIIRLFEIIEIIEHEECFSIKAIFHIH